MLLTQRAQSQKNTNWTNSSQKLLKTGKNSTLHQPHKQEKAHKVQAYSHLKLSK